MIHVVHDVIADVLVEWGAQSLIHTAPPVGHLHLETACCVYFYLYLNFKSFDDMKHLSVMNIQKIGNQKGGKHFFTPLYVLDRHLKIIFVCFFLPTLISRSWVPLLAYCLSLSLSLFFFSFLF